MIGIEYAPAFLRQFKKLPISTQEEAQEKIGLFKNRSNHHRLGVHKLKGKLRGKWSFSVNYSDRIVFKWIADNKAGLLAIGDHEIYR
ncbi:MAG TPA: type II toxin-antitoxin system mRNA interferase toxin, RelE/StbE family [Candidatus Paceibacterota bacterium]